MESTLKALIAKVWKDEDLDLEPGSHYVDEVLTIHVTGVVTKQSDTMVAPTTSIPLIPTLALFWEKSGITQDHALRMLQEAISEALTNPGKNMDQQIEARMKDVETAIQTVKDDLIASPLGTVKSRLHHGLEKLRRGKIAVNLFAGFGELPGSET